MANSPRPSAPRNAPESTPTFLGRGTRTTDEPAMDMSRGLPGDLMFEALPAEIPLEHFTGPHRNPRHFLPPPDPVGGYGTDDYAPGFIAGQRFPTWNITPGNRVFDLGNRIPSDWIPYRGAASDSVRDEGDPGQMWSTNFDPREAGMWLPSDLEARGEMQLGRNDSFNNPRIGFFGPLPTRFIPMRKGGRYEDGGEVFAEEGVEGFPQVFGASADDMFFRRQMLEAGQGGGSGGGSQGRPTYAVVPRYLEDALSQFSQGRMSSKAVQDAFRRQGWGVNLRKSRVGVEVTDPNGKVHYLNNGDFRRGGRYRSDGGSVQSGMRRLRAFMRMLGGRV